MDRALWITWYNLPAEGREAYLSWMHETYLPQLVKRPGYLWAAHYASLDRENKAPSDRLKFLRNTSDSDVPTGDRFIVLVGAEHANVFSNPVPSALHAALPDDGKQMLAMRVGERTNIMVEAARVEGPAAKDYTGGMQPTPCIQLGSYNCGWRDEEEMLAWYGQWRMAATARLPGVVRTRRLASVAGWAKHAVLYEFASIEIRNAHFPGHEDANPEAKAWSNRMVSKLTHAPGSANVAERIWPL